MYAILLHLDKSLAFLASLEIMLQKMRINGLEVSWNYRITVGNSWLF